MSDQDDKSKIAVIAVQIEQIQKDIGDMKGALSDKFVSKDQLETVKMEMNAFKSQQKMIRNGLLGVVGTILTAFINGLIQNSGL